MGQPCPVFVAQRVEKHLGFVFQPSEGIGVDNAITIYLEGRSDGTLGFLPFPAAGLGALAAERRHEIGFAFFELFADVHGTPLVISPCGIILYPVIYS